MRLHIGCGPMYFLRELFSDEHVGNLLVKITIFASDDTTRQPDECEAG